MITFEAMKGSGFEKLQLSYGTVIFLSTKTDFYLQRINMSQLDSALSHNSTLSYLCPYLTMILCDGL